MKTQLLQNNWRGGLVNICRLLVAVTFILSGIVKLIDPRGTQYKIEDYAAVFQMSDYLLYGLPLCFAVLLALFEFGVGVYMLFGIRRRLTLSALLLFMVVMTPFSFYLAITNPVHDCGCFGDAFTLSNWQTFGKNILLLAAVVMCACHSRSLVRFVSERNQWIIAYYALAFGFVLALYSIYRLPPIDFRPYSIGTNLPVEMEREMEEAVAEPRYADFNFITADGEDEVSWLQPDGYKFLLIAPYLESADDGSLERINELYEYAKSHDYPFLCLTSSDDEAIEDWCDRTGAEYSFAFTDGITLKTVIRSNPGLLLLQGGVIVGKWPTTNLPVVEQPELTADTQLSIGSVHVNPWQRLLAWFFIPLMLVTFMDRLWYGWKLLYKPNKNNKTMRKKIVAGNWKMNKTLQEGVALATELKEMLAAQKPNCEVIIGTPFIHLATVSELLNDSVIAVSAENCADKESGAYTGEVSAAMVKSTGAEYVILGHSERREYYHETPEILKEKVDLALANGLKVIFCIGESLAEREANQQEAVCKAELAGSVFHLTAEQWKNVVIAYEPIWAIGTGKTATSEQAEEIHAYIRACVAEVYGAEVADETSILYGGSCKASNAPELFGKPDIDGGLIGGASLKAADFKGIIDAWN